MEFTIKGLSPEKSEEMYSAILRGIATLGLPFTISTKRVFSIECEIDGMPSVLRVSDSRLEGQTVLVIIETEGGPFLICTYERGVSTTLPYIKGREEVSKVTYFD